MTRHTLLRLAFFTWFVAVLARLYYWQGMKATDLRAIASRQYSRSSISPSERGVIISADGYPLVLNTTRFTLIGRPHLLKENIDSITSMVLASLEYSEASQSGRYVQDRTAFGAQIRKKLSDRTKQWVPLVTDLSETEKQRLQALSLPALTFEESARRYYPEASLSAHLLGFVGKNSEGSDQGYFGLEGEYDLELTGRRLRSVTQTDAVGRPIALGAQELQGNGDGRSLQVTIRRDIQYLAQKHLESGMQKYGAKAGDVLIMEPATGKVIAMASYPTYDPGFYARYDTALYKNPAVADGYEPGSTFKVLTVAAGIDAGLITPQTRCDTCAGPVTIGKYTIKTWDNKYHADTTIQDGLTHSDNTAMVYIGRKLGEERFFSYIEGFGLGQKTGIDLQDESSPRLRPKKEWGEIDTATATFGQGIALTPIQMLNGVNAIANGGRLMRPYVVEKITKGEEEYLIKPQELRRVIKPETAAIVARMMMNSASQGDARWTLPRQYAIAGKTGTAQIPVAGHYDENRTIASFVGFAPVENPQFSMIVRLVEPTSSQWGSETAAPLWFAIAKDLFVKYGITPNKQDGVQ